ncbi:MAG: oxygen-independent coproporphyrinogen III oxidase [Rubrivivax sp.]
MLTRLPSPAPAPPDFSPELLRRFDSPGPRYTSYPTADRFVDTFGATDCHRALARTGPGGSLDRASPLSVYVHVPFCESVCYYCACNKVITRHHERATEYLDALQAELALVQGSLGGGRVLSQLHLGGGTPTFLSDAELQRLLDMLQDVFRIESGAELSIEVDPRTVSTQRLGFLRQLGFNRLSFGVQDFDPQVQQAVHRVQPYDSVRELIVSARELGFTSMNVDLIYGLPRQTPTSFARTLQQVAALRPDRIALYAYAHLPQRFKPQRRIVTAELPDAGQRMHMLSDAIFSFDAQGYDYIGMDHFALPDDALAVAKREGRLHRNFQGYSTQPDCDLIGLGVSAIGRVGASYYQNAKSLPEYYDALRQGQLPVQRGLTLSRDDEMRRTIIMALMCQGRLEFEPIEVAFGVRMHDSFAPELQQLEPLAEAGLLDIGPGAIQLTPAGWYVVRAVAMVFDRYVQSDRQRERYSRII